LHELLRRLPQTSALLDSEFGRRLAARYSREEVLSTLRDSLRQVREGLLNGALASAPDFLGATFFEGLSADIEAKRRSSLRRVINATGVIIHTNLGRAPLAPEALDAMCEVGEFHSNLELNLETGERGSRHVHVEALIRELTGAEAAVVVNNGAAAVMVCLMALARDREVIASRGELIEIGGGFRMPDVITESGARLREVGATNKTRINDYERAIGPETAVLLKSHCSNFRIVGFTAAPTRRELAELARAHELILMEDLGSGVLIDLAPYGLSDEPTVGQVLHEGVDVVTFSGDKLLGGPQAGVIAGRRSLIDRLKTHPMLRATRIDKLSLAALEATLRLYLPPHDPVVRIPVLSAIAQGLGVIAARARRVADVLARDPTLNVDVVDTIAFVGGGSLPQQGLRSTAVALRTDAISTEVLAGRLRAGRPSVIGRISDDRLLLDMRSVTDAQADQVAGVVRRALSG
jgi:L-seryl-tRNA(Ser) seleniumtransferase